MSAAAEDLWLLQPFAGPTGQAPGQAGAQPGVPGPGIEDGRAGGGHSRAGGTHGAVHRGGEAAAGEEEDDDGSAAAALALVDEYLAGLEAHDVARVEACISATTPLTYLGPDGPSASTTHRRGDPTGPAVAAAAAAVAERRGWARAVGTFDSKVIGLSGKKAHVLGSGTRLAADGSECEHYTAVYALGREGGRWRVFAVSEVVTPSAHK